MCRVRAWLALAYLIVFGSVIAFTAYNWLAGALFADAGGYAHLCESDCGGAAGLVVRGEHVSVNVMLSAAMVIAAVFLVDRGMARLETGEGK